MKYIFTLCISIFAVTIISAQSNHPDSIAIIPQPVKMVKGAGSFQLPASIVIQADQSPELKQTITTLTKHLTVPTGYKATTTNVKSPTVTVILTLNKTPDNAIGNEGYHLAVTTKQVTISANKPAGLSYGVQTFLQLLPKEIESITPVTNVKWSAPCVDIIDYPRFAWRGLMLDVSRHFFTKQEVKDFIDQMVRYKYNVLHMHLTDDQGWRIEIKSLPKLTSVGSLRVHKEGYFGTFSPPTPDEPRTEGGFYTQDDIKELVSYAKDRFVNILPEIDVPAHSLAAVASYPELSCTPVQRIIM